MSSRDAQLETGGRIAARQIARRQVDQEHGKTLLGPHIAEQEHHILFTHDLAAHEAVNTAQQCGQPAEQFFESRKRDFAHYAVFESDGVAIVALGADGIHAEQFTDHMEAGDLLLACGTDLKGFEVAGTYRE